MRYFNFIIILFLIGCTKEIDLKQVAYTPKVVVDGWIENDRKAQILLTMSSPFLTEYDSASIRNTFINYAKVTLTCNDGESEILTLKRQDEFFPPFVYETISMRGKVGHTYHLEISFQNKLITASTSIPTLPLVEQITYKATSDTSMIIEGHLDDPVDEKNYYYTQIKVLHFDTRYHPCGKPLKNDALFDGQKHSYQIKRSNQPDPLNIFNIDADRNLLRDEFAINDTIFVKVAQIDEQAYKILNGIYIDNLSQDSPFTFVDQETPTNIAGGIGHWTGMASRSYLIYK